jgi:hypothetical protein
MPSKEDYEQMTLGQLIEALNNVKDKDAQVSYDFCFFVPTTLDSFRGYYDQLALGYAANGEHSITVGELLRNLQLGDGRAYEGYKGGTYYMSKDTPLWVANYGEASPTAIVGVKEDYCVILLTKYIE